VETISDEVRPFAQEPIFDYERAFKAFHERLELLAQHITEHKMHQCWEEDAASIRQAIRLWEAIEEQDTLEAEVAAWNTYCNYVRDNARGWWC
jgi:hypothetical protein